MSAEAIRQQLDHCGVALDLSKLLSGALVLVVQLGVCAGSEEFSHTALSAELSSTHERSAAVL
jgi:hypothetical protein